MVTANSQDLEIILGCTLGIIFGLAVIITITVITGILIKDKFKGNYYSSCIFNNNSIISLSIFQSRLLCSTRGQHNMEGIIITVEPLYKDPLIRTPSVEKCTKLSLNEDNTFNYDTLSCPKGVRNRGVPLYFHYLSSHTIYSIARAHKTRAV
jgi:hypothetical protein